MAGEGTWVYPSGMSMEIDTFSKSWSLRVLTQSNWRTRCSLKTCLMQLTPYSVSASVSSAAWLDLNSGPRPDIWGMADNFSANISCRVAVGRSFFYNRSVTNYGGVLSTSSV